MALLLNQTKQVSGAQCQCLLCLRADDFLLLQYGHQHGYQLPTPALHSIDSNSRALFMPVTRWRVTDSNKVHVATLFTCLQLTQSKRYLRRLLILQMPCDCVHWLLPSPTNKKTS